MRDLMSSSDTVLAVLAQLADLGIDDVGAVVCAQPGVLKLSCARIDEATTFLEGYVDQDRVGEFVQLHPQSLLWRDVDALPVALHLRALGLSKSAIERVRTVLPTIDRVASAENVAAVLSYLQEELCLSKAGLGNLVGTYPQLLGLSLEQNVRPTVEYVKSLGVSPSKAFVRHPPLLGLSLEHNLRPSTAYLRNLGVNVSKAVSGHPMVLSLCLSQNVVPTVDYLRSIGMKEVGRVLSAQPAILSLSVDANLVPKVAFLRQIGIGDAKGGLGTQLDAYPALLTLSLEGNLRPTATALKAAGLIGGNASRALRPRHLAASLDGRLRPRLAFCTYRQSADATGTLQEWVGKGGDKVTLGAVTTMSDAAFAKSLGATAEQYADFKRAWLELHPRDGRKKDSGAQQLNIPWLPEGFDLAAALGSGSDVFGDSGQAQAQP